MPSRSNTRIGKDIRVTATPKQKSAVRSVCSIMDKILERTYADIESAAAARDADKVLDLTTDFRSLVYFKDGMCVEER